MVSLRPYQEQAVEAIENEWRMGKAKTLLVLPTGGGKTITFGKIASDVKPNGRTLILAHREELLEQASDKLWKAFGLTTSLEKASSTCLDAIDNSIVVGSVQSLCREERLKKFDKDFFKHIIIDEAHHVMSDSYQRIMEHFPMAKVLGVTATPDRADKKNLGKFFDSIAYEYTMVDAINDGYLSKIVVQMIPLEIDISNVTMQNGDYRASDISDVLEPWLNAIADEMLEYCKDRKTVVFLPLVATSKKFKEILNTKGFKAEEVNGESENRKEILKNFDDGKYNVLCNSMLLTEGWDCPSVDCIINLRPTKSRALYQQIIGRGTRLYDGKKNLLVLDFLWNTAKHSLCRPSSLVAKTEEIAKKIDKKTIIGEEIDLLATEKLVNEEVIKEREEALAKELALQRKKKRKLVDPLQYAFSIQCEDLIDYEPTMFWEQMPPSDKQIAMLENLGIYTGDLANRGMAKMIIDKIQDRRKFGLSTPKQIRFLENYGFKNVGTWKMEEASAMISQIANNKWYVPWQIKVKEYVPERLKQNV